MRVSWPAHCIDKNWVGIRCDCYPSHRCRFQEAVWVEAQIPRNQFEIDTHENWTMPVGTPVNIGGHGMR